MLNNKNKPVQMFYLGTYIIKTLRIIWKPPTSCHCLRKKTGFNIQSKFNSFSFYLLILILFLIKFKIMLVRAKMTGVVQLSVKLSE